VKREKGQNGKYGRQQKDEAEMEVRQARGSVGMDEVRELHCTECQYSDREDGYDME